MRFLLTETSLGQVSCAVQFGPHGLVPPTHLRQHEGGGNDVQLVRIAAVTLHLFLEALNVFHHQVLGDIKVRDRLGVGMKTIRGRAYIACHMRANRMMHLRAWRGSLYSLCFSTPHRDMVGRNPSYVILIRLKDKFNYHFA